MNRSVAVIWWGMLIATVVAVVPVTVSLLSRALTAARQIERYTADALEGGVKIAAHTANVSALKDTISVAPRLLTAAHHIEQHTAAIAGALAPTDSTTLRSNGHGEGTEALS